MRESSVTAVSYLVLITVENGELKVVSSGMYTDGCVNVGGEWKIRKRRLYLDLPCWVFSHVLAEGVV